MKRVIFWILPLLLLGTACGGAAGRPVSTPTPAATNASAQTAVATRLPADRYAEYEIVTLLPRDGIPAIDDPQFLSVEQADRVYDAQELIIGVEFNGDARAYSVPFLSGHEIVNDTVGGEKIAVTW